MTLGNLHAYRQKGSVSAVYVLFFVRRGPLADEGPDAEIAVQVVIGCGVVP